MNAIFVLHLHFTFHISHSLKSKAPLNRSPRVLPSNNHVYTFFLNLTAPFLPLASRPSATSSTNLASCPAFIQPEMLHRGLPSVAEQQRLVHRQLRRRSVQPRRRPTYRIEGFHHLRHPYFERPNPVLYIGTCWVSFYYRVFIWCHTSADIVIHKVKQDSLLLLCHKIKNNSPFVHGNNINSAVTRMPVESNSRSVSRSSC